MEEPGADHVLERSAAADVLATSRVALAEAGAGIARAWREGHLSQQAQETVLAELVRTWPDFLRVEVNERRAFELAVAHRLRGFDAIHLAAALDILDAAAEAAMSDPGSTGGVLERPPVLEFCSFDRRQWQAAQAEGVRVSPSEICRWTRPKPTS